MIARAARRGRRARRAAHLLERGLDRGVVEDARHLQQRHQRAQRPQGDAVEAALRERRGRQIRVQDLSQLPREDVAIAAAAASTTAAAAALAAAGAGAAALLLLVRRPERGARRIHKAARL
jgi:hypothetical protein